jgi:undecaprenyl-diphosphatase
MTPGLLGTICAFVAGLVALKWLSKLLENDLLYLFGIYCLTAPVAVGVLHNMGY